jgi:hypothetical protein
MGKLVRDKIPAMIEKSGEKPQIRILESGVRHAYRGLAIRMRTAWIQKEVN